MKILIYSLLVFYFMIAPSHAEVIKDCSELKSLVKKMKCKASNLNSKNFLKGTLEYQKKAFEKKENNNQ